MFDIRTPTFEELLARIDEWPTMTGPQLAAAIGAAEAKEIFRQLVKRLAKEEASPTTK